MQPWSDSAMCWARTLFSSLPAGESINDTQPKPSEARVAFKSPSGVSRTEKSADMAKDLGVEVEEVNSGVEGRKVLNFKGKGQGPAGQSKAAVESNKRDVFKASHMRQAEIGRGDHDMDATAHSVQEKYADKAHPATAAAAYPQKPQARGERLSEDRYRDTGSMIEKAAKQPAQPWSKPEEEQHSVSRYQAMKAAASAALNRASGMYASNQATAQEYGRAATQAAEDAYKKGRDVLDQGLQAVKDMATSATSSQDADPMSGPYSKEFPRTVHAENNDVKGRPMRPESGSSHDAEGTWTTGGATFRMHPRGGGATQQTSKQSFSEEAAHRGERDSASY
ncbi:hypothetical protein COCOBI_07-1790 [Coccomyxa sp. Obi]|nr:hypothetical protein COCOBI_07-1790 [Coccomyxa sp. Obi]